MIGLAMTSGRRPLGGQGDDRTNGSENRADGVAAFRQKREARFKGR